MNTKFSQTQSGVSAEATCQMTTKSDVSYVVNSRS